MHKPNSGICKSPRQMQNWLGLLVDEVNEMKTLLSPAKKQKENRDAQIKAREDKREAHRLAEERAEAEAKAEADAMAAAKEKAITEEIAKVKAEAEAKLRAEAEARLEAAGKAEAAAPPEQELAEE